MWKRYLTVYLAGMFLSLALIFLTSFVFDFFGIYRQPKIKGAGMEYWSEVFEKYRTEMRTLEEYYNRIENWDFVGVRFEAIDGLEIEYLCDDLYLSSYYMKNFNNVPTKFLKFFLENEDFVNIGYSEVTILGDYWGAWEYWSSFIPARSLVVRVTFQAETFYVYSPNGIPSGESEAQIVVTKPLGNDWYCCVRQFKEGVACY